MNLEIAIDQTRKTKLKSYLEENKSKYKSLTEFAIAVGLFASNLSPILNGDKKFTDKLAKTLEEKLGLETGFFSTLTGTNNDDILIPFRKLKKLSNNKISLIEDGTLLAVEANAISNVYEIENLFAIHPDFDLDRDALNKTIEKLKSLIFDSSDTNAKLNKIYLIYFANKLLLRRYTTIDGVNFFDTDQPSLYSKIELESNDVEIVARLVYSAISLKEH